MTDMVSLVGKYRKLILETGDMELLDKLYREYKMRVFDYFDGKTINEEWDKYISMLISLED